MAKKQTGSFLPPGYQPPKSKTNYLNKFPQGETKFRILSNPIMGYVGWKDKKPIRRRTIEEMKDIVFDKSMYNQTGAPDYFWAMVIWNYNESCVQILELTKLSIMTKITELANDPDWSSPVGYDIKVTRSGEGKKTIYSTNPMPHKDLTEEIKKVVKENPTDLEALFKGENPFQSSSDLMDDIANQPAIPF